MERGCRDAPPRAAMKRTKAFNVGLPRWFRPPRHNRVTERSLCCQLAGQVCGRLPAIPACGRLEQEEQCARRSFAHNGPLRASRRYVSTLANVIAERQHAPQCRQNTGIG
jgi:hypothetical protein